MHAKSKVLLLESDPKSDIIMIGMYVTQHRELKFYVRNSSAFVVHKIIHVAAVSWGY